MHQHRDNLKTRCCFILGALLACIGSQAAFAAKPDVMVYKFTLQEACTSGPPGTFTQDGDIIQPAGMGFSHVAGTMTFDATNGTLSERDEAVFQFPSGFDQSRFPNAQGIYPVRTFRSTCSGSFQLLPDLSFTVNNMICMPVGQNGPSNNVTTTITGMKLTGQFSPDLQSFVAASLGLTLELGSDSNGSQFQRYCGKTAQGVRTPKDITGPRPF